MSIEANKRMAADFFACFEKADVAGLLDRLTDDATWWIGGKPELFDLAGTKTKAQMAELLGALVPATKNGLSVTPSAMVAEGNKVAVEAESYGEFLNGRVYNNFYHFLLEFRGDKIASVKEYLDTQHTVETLKP